MSETIAAWGWNQFEESSRNANTFSLNISSHKDLRERLERAYYYGFKIGSNNLFGKNHRMLSFPLSNENSIVIHLPETMKAKEYDLMMNLMNLWKDALVAEPESVATKEVEAAP